MEAQKPIEWAIKEIKELEFVVNESVEVGATMDTNYTVDIQSKMEEDALLMSITFSFIKSETKEVIMRSKVMTIYLIKGLGTRIKKINDIEHIDLPDQLWIAIFSIAFTHTRAVAARSSAGSKYSNLLLPLINPEAEFKKLFGKLNTPNT